VPGAAPDDYTDEANPTSCAGAEANDGSVTVTPVLFQNAPFTYSLNNGTFQNSDSFPGLTPGTYVVVAKDMHGCTDTLAPVVVTEPTPANAVAFPTGVTVTLGKTVQLQSDLVGGSVSVINSYFWSPPQGLDCSDCQNPLATPYVDGGVFTVTITYNGHCTANASVLIHVNPGEVYIPNAFSPNGDGDNDVFYLYGYGIKVVILKVFNRWGEKVFESHDQLEGWDGSYKGVMQNPDVFVYEATVVFLDNTTKNFKGSLTLIR
jgi:gliding motility-associated-like protein